jgi:uncharacterized protein
MANTLNDLYPDLPGTSDLPAPPRDRYEQTRQRRLGSYQPRTRHLRPDGLARYTNRLFLESSPYLLQHAHNPVNWFSWSEEAFLLARQKSRPVLVSIGYATCHWCHVMEEESFEDEEIARYINQNFVAIKVDREERPDVDAVYMTAVHAMGVQGGWPLNVFLSPDRQPFYGGTYFPPYDHSRGMGFLSLLKRLAEAFRSAPDRVTQAGRQVTKAVQAMLKPVSSSDLHTEAPLQQAVQTYREGFDALNGGMRGAPKFPSSLPVRLLLRAHLESGSPDLLDMSKLTLQRMSASGIYDQIGGGFHRYATDEQWMIPHFEKMLYDNAILAISYLEGYQLTGDEEIARVTREILRYLQRDMADPEGGFYAATDADSLAPSGKREEGFFFTWTPEEVAAVLGEERGGVVAAALGITTEGNFEGRSIPHRRRGMPDIARETGLSEQTVKEIVGPAIDLLYQVRKRRPLPLRDEKVLASWNGLALSAFARAGAALYDSASIAQAERTAAFLIDSLIVNGRLAHSYQEGAPKGEGFLDDYAFIIAGLIDLFEATGTARWLERALELAAVAQKEFKDEDAGGFFMTGPHHEELIAREKPGYDGVVPSGNSVMIMNLLRLTRLTEEPRYLEAGQRGLDAFASQLSASPTALSEMLLALDFLEDVERDIVIVAPQDNSDAARPLLEQLRRAFLPNRVLICATEGEELERARRLVPMLREKRAEGDKAVAYYCENRSCRLPTSDPAEFQRQLKEAMGSRKRGSQGGW